MTEDEAKTKWCPFGRTQQYSDPVTVNRGAREQDWTFCIASACMAWRETKMVLMDVNTLEKVGDAPSEGYCGLAGQPK
jgi:hypothetical protein